MYYVSYSLIHSLSSNFYENFANVCRVTTQKRKRCKFLITFLNVHQIHKLCSELSVESYFISLILEKMKSVPLQMFLYISYIDIRPCSN